MPLRNVGCAAAMLAMGCIDFTAAYDTCVRSEHCIEVGTGGGAAQGGGAGGGTPVGGGAAGGGAAGGGTAGTDGGPPANDTCATAQTVSRNDSVQGTTVGATNDYSTFGSACPVTGAGNDVVYELVANSTAFVDLQVVPDAQFDAQLEVFADQCVPSSCAAAQNAADAGQPESLRIGVVVGHAYFIVVDGAAGSSGAFVLHVQ